jgi:hypothetical protein
MKRFTAILGLVLILLPQEALGKELYETVRELTRTELLLDDQALDDVELPVKNFTAQIYPQKEAPLTADDVTNALRREYQKLCGKSDNDKKRDIGTCPSLAEQIRAYVDREERIRTLGRDLQIIASSYESAVDGFPERVINLPLRYTSIVKLWETGTGSTLERAGSGLIIRVNGIKEDDATMAQKFDALASVLQTFKGQDLDKFVGAVWRYQHGYRYVTGQRVAEYPPPPDIPESGGGSERRYLKERWPDIESALAGVYSSLPATFDPPLRKKEIVLFRIPKKFQDKLPEGAIVWAYFENIGTGTTVKLSGDAGLQWRTPVEPVEPALKSSTGAAILGGTYPPEPVSGGGLCLHPFARLGYLCRPLLRNTDKGCTTDPPKDNVILLTTCKADTAKPETLTGPDVCIDVSYRIKREGNAGSASSELPYEVCQPNQETEYRNTIGNTMCYVGQCVEQSLEAHRLIGGRSPFVPGDEAYPWDSCVQRDPEFATLLTPPPATTSWFPSYRPEELIRSLDSALCQTNGLPPQMPPVLCSFAPEHRIRLPLQTYLETAGQLANQAQEHATPTAGLQHLSEGLGARLGTSLYREYLLRAGHVLGEITSMTTDLFTSLAKMKFTREMCPRNGALENGLTSHGACASSSGSP